MEEDQINSLIKSLATMKEDLKALQDEFYKNNFSAHQDFTKASSFTSKLKVPHYDVIPTVCETGEIIENSGKLYICSSTNVYSVVGTQT